MPTTNPVPSQDPSDLVFNAGKMDEVVNATASTFTDRLGNVRQTLAGLSAEFPQAQANADAAADSALDALASANAAALDAADAEAAKVAAEAARDAATSNADVYVDVSTGLASVANGEQFQVVSADGLSVVRYRRDSASVAVEVASYPTAEYVFSVTESVDDSASADPAVGGFLGLGSQAVLVVRASGQIDNVHIAAIESDAAAGAIAGNSVKTITDTSSDPVVGGFMGEYDQSVFHVRASGQIENTHVTEIESRISYVEQSFGDGWSEIKPVAEFLHFMIYGQSLSVGELGTPVRSTAARSWAKRFTGGVVSYLGTDPGRYASLVSLNETTQETIATGMLDMIRQLLMAEDGIDIAASGLLPFATASGYGGQSADQLSIGSTHFTRLQTDITQGAARAGDAGKAYQPLVMPYLQGEQDYTIGTAAGTWKTRVRKIRTDAEAHCKLTSGIDRPLPMIVYQLSQHIAKSVQPTLALEAVEMCADDYIGFATPLYFIPAVDTAHRNADGYYWLGAYFGLAIKRWLWDGKKPMPMSPSNVVWTNTFVSIQFQTQVGGLALDTTMVDNPGDYGFRLYQSDGVTPISITGVSISGPDRVIIKAASIPAGARLRYAWENAAGDVAPFEGPINGARGCLRDSRGATLVADPTGSQFPLHQFAPIFEEIRS